jgi:hypothetical protein
VKDSRGREKIRKSPKSTPGKSSQENRAQIPADEDPMETGRTHYLKRHNVSFGPGEFALLLDAAAVAFRNSHLGILLLVRQGRSVSFDLDVIFFPALITCPGTG